MVWVNLWRATHSLQPFHCQLYAAHAGFRWPNKCPGVYSDKSSNPFSVRWYPGVVHVHGVWEWVGKLHSPLFTGIYRGWRLPCHYHLTKQHKQCLEGLCGVIGDTTWGELPVYNADFLLNNPNVTLCITQWHALYRSFSFPIPLILYLMCGYECWCSVGVLFSGCTHRGR